MLVETIREHSNDYGEAKADGSHRPKKVGDVYEHPDPKILIASGFVVDATDAQAEEDAAAQEAETAPSKIAKSPKKPDA